MRYFKFISLSISLICVLVSTKTSAQNNTSSWPTYSIPNVCSFQIPTTMEVRSDESVHSQFIKAVHNSSFYEMLCKDCDVFFEESNIIIQPKGLNSNPSTDEYRLAADSYARILMKFSYFDELSQEDLLGITPSELMIADSIFYSETKREIECMVDHFPICSGAFKWFPLRVESYSNLIALVAEYNRPGIEGETRVREYKFFYNKKYFRIITSYKLREETKYKEDFRTFMKLLKIETGAKTGKGQNTTSIPGLFSSDEYHIRFEYDKKRFSEVKKQNSTSHCFFKMESKEGSQILFSAWDQGSSTDNLSIYDYDIVSEILQMEKDQKLDVIKSCEKVKLGNTNALKCIYRNNVYGTEYIYTTYRAYYKNYFYTFDFHVLSSEYQNNKSIVDELIKGLKFN